jgi:hypothetical protein
VIHFRSHEEFERIRDILGSAGGLQTDQQAG